MGVVRPPDVERQDGQNIGAVGIDRRAHAPTTAVNPSNFGGPR